MILTKEQQSIINHPYTCTVLGSPGTGKSTTLVYKVAHLIEKGVRPEEIAIITFSWRSKMLLHSMLRKCLGARGDNVLQGTLRDFAVKSMEQVDAESLKFADNAMVRRMLRKAIKDVAFPGSVTQAENIIRSFKSRARKPKENEAYFELLRAYKNQTEQGGYVDRHDMVRRHILGIRNGKYQPVGVKYIFIDNVQDSTQVQLLWLFEHFKAGIVINAFGDDDLCLFGLSGAVGGQAFHDLEALEGVSRLTLSQNFRVPKPLVDQLTGFRRTFSGRLERATDTNTATLNSTDLVIKNFGHYQEEMDHLVNSLKSMVDDHTSGRIGVVVRFDRVANYIQRALNSAGIDCCTLGRSVWEVPGATLMLDLLRVLLNQANNVQLRYVLVGYGLNQAMVDMLFSQGLVAEGWLQRGAPLPDGLDLGADSLKAFATVQRRLSGYWKVMREGKVSPRDVFKAAAYDLLEGMEGDERKNALLAMDTLISLKGRLAELLPTIDQEITPNLAAKVVLAPVREVRNMEFDTLFLPFMADGIWSPPKLRVSGENDEEEHRYLYLALSRAKGPVFVTHSGKLSGSFKKFQSV